MAPIADPADIGLSDIFAQGGSGPAGHLAAWTVLVLFVAALLAIWDERRDFASDRRRGPR